MSELGQGISQVEAGWLTSAVPEQINKLAGQSVADGNLDTFVTAHGINGARRFAESGKPGLMYLKKSSSRLDIAPILPLQWERQ